MGMLSPRLETAHPIPDVAAPTLCGPENNEHLPESVYNNFLLKPSTPVHRPDPQEPCFDIAAPPTPAPAALPPLDIDDISEPHHSEPNLVPSDLPSVTEEPEEEEEEDDEGDLDDRADGEHCAPEGPEQTREECSFSPQEVEDPLRKSWSVESPDRQALEDHQLTPPHLPPNHGENSCDHNMGWNSEMLLKSPHRTYREIEAAVSKITSPYSHSDSDLHPMSGHPSVTPPYSTYSRSYVADQDFDEQKEAVADIPSPERPDTVMDGESNYLSTSSSSTRLESFFTDCNKPTIEESHQMDTEPTCVVPDNRQTLHSFSATTESHMAPAVVHEPVVPWADPFSADADELDDLGPFSLPDLPLPDKSEEADTRDTELTDKTVPTQIRHTITDREDPDLMEEDLPSLPKTACAPGVLRLAESPGRDLLVPSPDTNFQQELDPEPQSVPVNCSLSFKQQGSVLEGNSPYGAPDDSDGSMMFPSVKSDASQQHHMQIHPLAEFSSQLPVESVSSATSDMRHEEMAEPEAESMSCSPLPQLPVAVTISNTLDLTDTQETTPKLTPAPLTTVSSSIDVPKKVEEIPQRMTRNRAQMLAKHNPSATAVPSSSSSIMTSSAPATQVTTSPAVSITSTPARTPTPTSASTCTALEKDKEPVLSVSSATSNATATVPLPTPVATTASVVLSRTTKGRSLPVEEEESQTQHPRKRKFPRSAGQQVQVQLVNTAMQQTREMIQQTLAVVVNAIKLDDIEPYHSDRSNPYFEYLQIRKKIEEKRKILCYITPQAPQCYAEYVTYTGSYLLDGKPLSKLHIPVVSLGLSPFT